MTDSNRSEVVGLSSVSDQINLSNIKTGQKQLVNFVTSDQDVSEGLSNIFQYFDLYGSGTFEYVVSKRSQPKCDIYHYHGSNFVNQSEKPAVVTVHHDLEDGSGQYDWKIVRESYRSVDKVICLNSSQRRFLVEHGISRQVINIIPYGYNEDRLKLKTHYPFVAGGKLTIGIASGSYSGRVKGGAYLLDLTKKLDPKLVRFVVVGQSGGVRSYEMMNFGFEVRCFEYLPCRIIQNFYNNIDLLLMASELEGGPACIPECLATGTPAICWNVGMATDLIVEGENGFFLSGDTTLDAGRIMSLLDNDGQCLRGWERGLRNDRRQLISWKYNVAVHEGLFLTMIRDAKRKWEIGET